VRYGSNMAVLEGALSSEAGADGIVKFDQLKIVTATSPYIFINFMADDVATGWSSASQDPKPSNVFPAPLMSSRSVRHPIILRTQVANISIVGRTDGLTYETTNPPQFSVAEEQVFDMKVVIKDSNGRPLSGVKALAYLVKANGQGFAHDYFPDLVPFGPRPQGKPIIKDLRGVLSEASNENGIAHFKTMGFNGRGAIGRFVIQFAAEGTKSFAWQEIEVTTRVSRILITVQPGTIGIVGMQAPDPRSLGSAEATTSEVDANLLILSADSSPISDKNATVQIVDAVNHLPVNLDVAEVFVAPLTESYNAEQSVSSKKGNLRVPLRFTFVDHLKIANLGGIKAIFYVDGVASAPTEALQFSTTDANSHAGSCTSILVHNNPPDIMDPPFHKVTTTVTAVDALGNPVPNVKIFPRLVKREKRVPTLYKIGAFSPCTAAMQTYVGQKTGANASSGCEQLSVNDALLFNEYSSKLQGLDSASIYLDKINEGIGMKGSNIYNYQTDSNGQVTLTWYLVSGALGTMAMEFRGLDYGCRSKTFYQQVHTKVHSVAWQTTYNSSPGGVLEKDGVLPNEFAYWPWASVDQRILLGSATSYDRFGQPVAGQWVDFDYVATPNNFWVAYPWQFMSVDVYFLTTPCATPSNYSYGVCQRARFGSAHLNKHLTVGLGSDFYTDTNGEVKLYSKVHSITATGAWDTFVTCAGQVPSTTQILQLRFDNPVESMTWKRQPFGELMEQGAPLTIAPYVRLNVKSKYANITALQCPFDDANTIAPEASLMIQCNENNYPFYLQRAPIHAYYTCDNSISAAFADITNIRGYGTQMNSFPHGPFATSYADFQGLFIAYATKGAVVQVHVVLSYTQSTRVGMEVFDVGSSGPSTNGLITTNWGSSSDAFLQITQQPSKSVALGSIFATPPIVELTIPSTSTNSLLLDGSFMIAILPVTVSGSNLHPKSRWPAARAALSHFYCLYQKGTLLNGLCHPETLTRTANGNYNSSQITFRDVLWARGKSNDKLKLAFFTELNLGDAFPNSTAQMSSLGQGDINEIALSNTPDKVAVVTNPPTTISVGEVFEFSCVVTVDGSALGQTSVQVNVTHTTSTSQAALSAEQYINSKFNPDPASELDVTKPVLAQVSVKSYSDKYGVARFLLTFESAPPLSYNALQCSAGSAKSVISSPFIIRNPIVGVTLTPNPRQVTTTIGTKNIPTMELKSFDFPQNHTLGPFEVMALVNTSEMQYTDSLYLSKFIPASLRFVLIAHHDGNNYAVKQLEGTANAASNTLDTSQLEAKSKADYIAAQQAAQANYTRIKNEANACETLQAQINTLVAQVTACQTAVTAGSGACTTAQLNSLAAQLATQQQQAAPCIVILNEESHLKQITQSQLQAAKDQYETRQRQLLEDSLKQNVDDNSPSYYLSMISSSSQKLSASLAPVTSAHILGWDSAQSVSVVQAGQSYNSSRRSGVVPAGMAAVYFTVPSLNITAQLKDKEFWLALQVQGIASNLLHLAIAEDYHSNLLPSARKLQEGSSSKKMNEFEKGFLGIGLNTVLTISVAIIAAGNLEAWPIGWMTAVSFLVACVYFGLLIYDASLDGWDDLYALEVGFLGALILCYLYMFVNSFRDRKLEWIDPEAHDYYSKTHIAYYVYVRKLLEQWNYDIYQPDPEEIEKHLAFAQYKVAQEKAEEEAHEHAVHTENPLAVGVAGNGEAGISPTDAEAKEDSVDLDNFGDGVDSAEEIQEKGSGSGVAVYGTGPPQMGSFDGYQLGTSLGQDPESVDAFSGDGSATGSGNGHHGDNFAEQFDEETKKTAYLMARQKKKDEEMAILTSPLGQFKLSIKYGISGENPDCFFYPCRVLAMVPVAAVTLYITIVKLYDFNVDTYNDITQEIRNQGLTALFAIVKQLETEYYSLSGGFNLGSAAEAYSYSQAFKLNDDLVGLANAIYNSWYVGVGVASLFGIWAVPVHLGCVRMLIILTRRGMWEEWFPIPLKEKVTVTYIIYYLPTLALQFTTAWLILMGLVWIISTFIWWSVSRDYIGNLLGPLLISLLFTFLNLFFIIYAMGKLGSPKRIEYRKLYLLFDFYEGMLAILGSLVDALLRVIEGFIFLILGLFRMEHSIQPNWTNHYVLQLDKPPKCTAAVVMMAHTHQNPVMNVFCDLLRRDCKEKNSQLINAEDREEGIRCRRAQRRWTLAKLLVLNPSLVFLRKHNLPPLIEKPPSGKKKKSFIQRCCSAGEADSDDDVEETTVEVKEENKGGGCCGRKKKDEETSSPTATNGKV